MFSSFYVYTPSPLHLSRCRFTFYYRGALLKYENLVSLGTRVTAIIGDIFVLLVTWSKTASSYREARRLGIRAPLATLLLRDGEYLEIACVLLQPDAKVWS